MTAAERRRRLDEGWSPRVLREFLERQIGVPDGYVELDDGRIVRDGSDADDECD